MEFTKSFNEMISMVENLFKAIEVPTKAMYYCSPEWDYFTEKCANNNIKVSNGLTKFVLFFDDFVIKIPFAGDYYYYYEKQESEYRDYLVNHCEREAADYDTMCSTEIGFLLCPTEYVGQLGELKIYAQPKCEPYSYMKHSPSKRAYKISEEFDYYECTADDDEVIALFAEEFGYDAPQILEQLDDFNIKDIHSGNVGFLNGKLIIFDFCGYHQ